MDKKHNLFYQLKIVSVVLAAIVFTFFLYRVLSSEMNEYKTEIIANWTQWQNNTVSNMLYEAISFEGLGDFENFTVQNIIPRLKFNEASYAVFYCDNTVIYENNSELTKQYAGKTIRETYGAYSYMGGEHISEVLEKLEEGKSGSDYFIKTQSIGKEYITWITLEHNGKIYTIGSISDEKYILNSYNFYGRKSILYALSFVYTFLLILFAAFICFETYKNNTAVRKYEIDSITYSNLITRLKANINSLEERFEKLSIYDFLTGLYNRKFFDVFFPKLEADIFIPVTIAIIDIDALNIINSAFGYQKGDEVIIGIAAIISEHCEESNVIARYGTDEFAIIMTNTTGDQATKQLTKISNDIKEKYIDFAVEISFGIGTKENENDNIYEVISIAEKNLQIDKLTSTNSKNSGSVNMLRRILLEKTTETEEHCERIREYVEILATAIGMNEKKIRELGLLAYLHDVGKIAIPDAILNKNGPLTEEEFEVIKTHPTVGYNIAMSSPNLKMISKYILQHHERWDGQGYPKGISGEDITIEARIIAIADAYDAMVSKRVYKEGYDIEESLDEIEKCGGTQFDPYLATTFVSVMRNEISHERT